MTTTAQLLAVVKDIDELMPAPLKREILSGRAEMLQAHGTVSFAAVRDAGHILIPCFKCWPCTVPSVYACGALIWQWETSHGIDAGQAETKPQEYMGRCVAVGKYLRRLMRRARRLASKTEESRDEVMTRMKSLIDFPSRNSDDGNSDFAPSPYRGDDAAASTAMVPISPSSDSDAESRHGPERKRMYRKTEDPLWVVPTDTAGPSVIVTPVMQSSMARKIAQKKLTESRIIDGDRVMPQNFKEENREAYIRLPEECLPQKPSNGKHNFTIADTAGAVVEVHLRNKAFFIKRKQGGEPWRKRGTVLVESPQVAWGSCDTVEAAWEKVKAKMGGWRLLGDESD